MQGTIVDVKRGHFEKFRSASKEDGTAGEQALASPTPV